MIISAMLMAAEVSQAPAIFPRLAPCVSPNSSISEPCVLDATLRPEELATRIGGKSFIWWIDGDRLTVVARPRQENWVMLCCSIQTPLEPVEGTALAAITVRVPRIQEAILAIGPYPLTNSRPAVFRGRQAKPAPQEEKPPRTRLIHIRIHSRWLDSTRSITVYLPPYWHRGAPIPTLYMADDLAPTLAPILEAAIARRKLPPIAMVSIAAAQARRKDCLDVACDRRGLEYKLDMNDGEAGPKSVFGRHMRFVVDEVIPMVEKQFGIPSNRHLRLVGGTSNGADWAFNVALLRRDLFGSAMILSSSGEIHSSIQRHEPMSTCIFGAAGIFEPDYLANTKAAVDAVRQAGAKVQFQAVVGGHEQNAWKAMFGVGIRWLAQCNAWR